jgi:hypothetical protein
MIRTKRTDVTTSTTIMAATLAIVLFALAPTPALATDVALVNYAAYTFLGDSADLMTDGVQNLDTEHPSNLLRLELWAFASPYEAGMSGTRLAVYGLPFMDPGFQTGKIDSGPVPFTLPPNGVWYFSMLLTEYAEGPSNNDNYVVRHWINFQTPQYIGVSPPPNKVAAVEFYHAGFDHYFVAASAQDIFDLDTGVHSGWSRTNENFNVWDGAGGNTNAVCRYYIPPGYGDSHFFSAAPDECAIALVKFPWLFKETESAFYIALPDTTSGACATSEIPVYRLWNGRADSNHRYTTSAAVKSTMIAKGYIAEGYGPDQVDMCAPE